ncbi:MAG: hypothetical protein QOI25_4688, partial [Mycobacterium sp.]|jgi:tetratricopeptide (TPR) repeat protein|nr:hypothetical protein [Mycobacterium sp.]
MDGTVEDLNQAVEVATAVVDAVRPGQPGRTTALNALGNALSTRYDDFGDRADLERAIKLYTEATELSPSPTYLHNLSGVLIDRYKADGRAEDLDTAIDAAERAVTFVPDGSHWKTLGNALRLRYDITGAPEVLDRAIEVHLNAVAATDPAAPTWPGRSQDLGNALLDRYQQTGSLADLDEAIRVFTEAVDATPERSPDRAAYLNNVGNGLRTRYWHTHDADELDRAITAFEQAVALRGDDPIYLDNLGNALCNRATRNGDGDDLANSLDAHRSAVARLAPDAPELPRCLANLGTTLWARYQAYDERPDLAEAIVIQERAVAATPAESPDLPMRLNNLALVIRERADVTGDSADRMLASGTYRRASALGLRSDPLWAMQSALNWARWCDERTDWPEAAEAYGLALSGMNRLYGSQHIRPHKELMLSATRTLAGAAAYAIARAGQPLQAAQAAERARALMLSEALELRPPDPGAALTFPGFDAVVYLVSVANEGLALVRTSDRDATAVFLPRLDEPTVRSYTRLVNLPSTLRQGATDRLGRWLWTAMAEPVLAALPLGATSVALIAVGALGLLPLHAAWTPDRTRRAGRRYLIDHCAVSYQPNARLLGREPGTASRLLAVSNPDGSLPSARHEFTAVAARIREAVQLTGPEATKEAVLAAMRTVDVHHFACHGYARPDAPLESAVMLAGGEPLTLHDILEIHLDARLAVLSACHTQIPGHHLPDEVISLPTALLQAGVRGVIASHWEVSGMATVLLMSRFYQHWHADQQPPGQALQRAQQWLRDTTNAEKIADLHPVHDRWARRRLMARPPQERDFAAPGIWASFSHTGV